MTLKYSVHSDSARRGAFSGRGMHISLVLALIMTQLVFVSGTASAVHADPPVAGHTGEVTETATVVETVFFIDLETEEVQSVWNDATEGAFTLSFGGETTVALAFDAGAATVEAALDDLVGIVSVSVTGSGTQSEPWLVTFVRGVAMMTEGSHSWTVGTTTISEVVEGLSAPIDPAGITYLSDVDRLLVSDSEINEEPSVFDGINVWELTRGGAVDRTSVFDETPIEPTGLAYNPANGHVYISNDNSDRIYDVDLGGDGIFGTGDDEFTFLHVGALPFGISDPEDVAWDPVSEQIFIAGGTDGLATPVSPGPDGLFDGVDDVAGPRLDVSAFVGDMEGIVYRAASDTLLITDATFPEEIYEITKDGKLIRTIDINAISRIPGDLAIAPATNTSGDHLYLVDRWFDNTDATPPPRDGRMYELSVPFTNLAPFVEAGDDQVVASGDPAVLVGEDSYDDGQGSGPGYTSPPFVAAFTWSKVDGPGTVTFGDEFALNTNANFSTDGVYVLKLEATDGDLTSEDTIQVTVDPPPRGGVGGGGGGGGGAPPPAVETCPDTLADPGFTDLAAISDEAKHAVACLVAYEITEGTSATTFSPMLPVTRWQMALFLIRQTSVHGVPLPAVEQHGFTDIGGLASTTQDAINQLATLGITEGTSATTFDPFADVSRWQMALFLTRMADLVGVPLPVSPNGLFLDVGGLTAEAQLAINQLAAIGIAKGTSSTTFDPTSDVLRWQMALFLTRLLEADGVLLE